MKTLKDFSHSIACFLVSDKNLGRWVNRQRSMFQAGKLRKDRQLELERIGLKWSMLATTSWDVMFDTLVVYVACQNKDGKTWDGNVPANYRTEDDPPRSLGRWINRQRSAHTKRKLKLEYVDKLNALGLKWSIHNRQGENDGDNEIDDDYDSEFDYLENKIKDKPVTKQNLGVKAAKTKVASKAKITNETTTPIEKVRQHISPDKDQVKSNQDVNAQKKIEVENVLSATAKGPECCLAEIKDKNNSASTEVNDKKCEKAFTQSEEV